MAEAIDAGMDWATIPLDQVFPKPKPPPPAAQVVQPEIQPVQPVQAAKTGVTMAEPMGLKDIILTRLFGRQANKALDAQLNKADPRLRVGSSAAHSVRAGETTADKLAYLREHATEKVSTLHQPDQAIQPEGDGGADLSAPLSESQFGNRQRAGHAHIRTNTIESSAPLDGPQHDFVGDDFALDVRHDPFLSTTFMGERVDVLDHSGQQVFYEVDDFSWAVHYIALKNGGGRIPVKLAVQDGEISIARIGTQNQNISFHQNAQGEFFLKHKKAEIPLMQENGKIYGRAMDGSRHELLFGRSGKVSFVNSDLYFEQDLVHRCFAEPSKLSKIYQGAAKAMSSLRRAVTSDRAQAAGVIGGGLALGSAMFAVIDAAGDRAAQQDAAHQARMDAIMDEYEAPAEASSSLFDIPGHIAGAAQGTTAGVAGLTAQLEAGAAYLSDQWNTAYGQLPQEPAVEVVDRLQETNQMNSLLDGAEAGDAEATNRALQGSLFGMYGVETTPELQTLAMQGLELQMDTQTSLGRTAIAQVAYAKILGEGGVERDVVGGMELALSIWNSAELDTVYKELEPWVASLDENHEIRQMVERYTSGQGMTPAPAP